MINLFKSKNIKPFLVSWIIYFTGSSILFANPTEGTVVSGSASISSAGNTTTINQSSDKAIINWNSFSIGAGETTRFNQPSSSSIALNRVTGNDPSSIFGNLSANGKIMLINPNGILFGKGSNVDVAGLIATTAQIKDSDFLNGNHTFIQDANKTAGIVNEGTIKVADTGLAALVAPSVENRGIIQANLGKVVLGSGKAFTVVDTYGDNLIQFATDSELANAKVSNSGTILANGGKVLMTAKAAAGVVDNVINMDGVIEANSVSQRNGEIILSGGNHGIVKVTGTVKAKGQTAGLKGGSVKITGENIKLLNNSSIDVSSQTSGGNIDIKATDTTQANGRLIAQGNTGDGGFIETSALHHLDITGIQVNTSSAQGKTGTWLLDPQDITIDTAYAANIVNNLANNNVTIQTNATSSGNGDISVNSAINWTSNNSLTLIADHNITINAGINGTNGSLFLEAGNQITPNQNGAINVKNFTLQNGDYIQNANGGNLAAFNVRNDFQVNGGSFLRVKAGDGSSTATAYQIVDVYGLQGIGTHLDKLFVLNNNINAASTANWNNGKGFKPIGNDTLAFSGQLDGQANVVQKLTVNRNQENYVGLFGYIGTTGTVKNLGLTETKITGATYTGSMAGQNDGHISQAYATGVIKGSSFLGGLVGYNKNGFINLSFTNANVSGTSATGGLAGVNNSQITDSYSLGNVFGSNEIGGLVGVNFESGNISNAYSTANVHGQLSSIGGLVGSNRRGQLVNVHATGQVNGSSQIGGLVGWNDRGQISQAYSSGQVNGDGRVGGLVGESSSDSTYKSLITQSHSSGQVSASGTSVGGFVGANSGDITDSYSTGNVVGNNEIGGFIGTHFEGNINRVNSSSNVSGVSNVGGLIGSVRKGTLITNAYSAGNVIATGNNAGGLVGINIGGTLSKVYSVSNVSGNSRVGGLIGYNLNQFTENPGKISQSYSSGKVTGSAYVGGLIGYNNAIDVSQSFWDINTSTQHNAYGYAGNSNLDITGGCFSGINCGVNLSDINTYRSAGWDITNMPSQNSMAPSNTWFIFDGDTRPILMSEWSTDITNSHQLQLIGTTLGANYKLANNIDLSNITNASEIWGTQISSGKGFKPIASDLTTDPDFSGFSGQLDGQQHIIKNLYINRPTEDDIGLFGLISNSSTLYQLGLENVQIVGNNNVGGIAGNNHGTLNQVYSTGQVKGLNALGGLAGINRGNINQAYSITTVSGNNLAGGLVGKNMGNIESSYSVGKVTGNLSGGLIGENTQGNLADNYWVIATSGLSNSVGSGIANGMTALTIGQLMSGLPAGFGNADWSILVGKSLPYFKWQIFNNASTIPGIDFGNSHQEITNLSDRLKNTIVAIDPAHLNKQVNRAALYGKLLSAEIVLSKELIDQLLSSPLSASVIVYDKNPI